MLTDISMRQFQMLPREINIEVTQRCNLACPFCHNRNSFANNGVRCTDELLSTEQVNMMIDNAAASGIKRVRFTGGEPMMRTDIYSLAEHALSKGMKTVLNTNGTLIDKTNASTICELFNICLISLPSGKCGVTDAVSGVQGVFRKKLNALECLSKCEQLWCSTLMGKTLDIDDIGPMGVMMNELGVQNWFLLRTNGIPEDKTPVSKDYLHGVINRIKELRDNGKPVPHIGNAVPFCCEDPDLMAEIVDDGAFFCEGRSKLTVNPSGRFVVDYCIDETVGNALTDNHAEVWQCSALKRFRDGSLSPQRCKNCKYYERCLGGSRFAAKIAYGDYTRMDPLADPDSIDENR